MLVWPRRWRLRPVPLVHVRRLLRTHDDVDGNGEGEAVQHLGDFLLGDAVLVPPLQLKWIKLPAGVRLAEVHSVASFQGHFDIRLHFPGLDVGVVNDNRRTAVIHGIYGSPLVPFMSCSKETRIIAVAAVVSKIVICAQD